jgi:hypothetical protein
MDGGKFDIFEKKKEGTNRKTGEPNAIFDTFVV